MSASSAPPGARPIDYHHVDVFSGLSFSGNSLAVFVDPPALTQGQMERITRELRHFESVFVTVDQDGDGTLVDARIFDLVEELPFAGHPVLGAVAVLQARRTTEECWWTVRLPARTVRAHTRIRPGGHVAATLHLDCPEVISAPRRPDGAGDSEVAAALGLDPSDLHPDLPLEVLSTGLRYLLVPVRHGDALARARISTPRFGDLLAARGAEYVYVLDVEGREGRHWTNDGAIEDVATGSAAGCVAAYLLRHGRTRSGEEVALRQGRYVGRPSAIAIAAHGTAAAVERVTVGGDVAAVGAGWLHAPPAPDLR